MRPASRGYSLAELLTIVAIIGLTVLVAVPAFGSLRRRSAVRAASYELRAVFHEARSRAIARGANVGVRFIDVEGTWMLAIFDDGDGDGVKSEDIKRGTDPVWSLPRTLLPPQSLARIGMLAETIKDPDGDKMPPTKSPVQFGRTQICSFSPMGESTPGTIYLTDRAGVLYAVRVYGATARMRVLRYDAGARKWREQ
ncbi:MAG TPA: GspH/FimT family pseudopilin [Thermoanaerobaculia bacterium]